MPQIRKPLADVDAEDLQALCLEQAIEDEQIDFKEAIPHKQGADADPWRDNLDLKEYGRDALLQSVVAFANSYGGDLIVGIRETKGQPGRAESVTPIRECDDAAHRLSQAAAAIIDPPIPNLQFRGVRIQGNDGVVVMRVPKSRLAPHRLTSKLHCYQRVRHETKEMSMRQIQDLTFAVARGLEGVDRRFSELKASFRRWSLLDVGVRDPYRYAIRVSGVPSTSDCTLERVHKVDAVQPRIRRVKAIRDGSAAIDLIVPGTTGGLHAWRPLLRGSGSDQLNNTSRVRIEVYCDGVITCEYGREWAAGKETDTAGSFSERSDILYPMQILGMVVNVIESLQRFRIAAGATSTEYALELEVANTGEVQVPLGDMYQGVGKLPSGERLFPRYAIGTSETWQDTIALVHRDIWNSLGEDDADRSLQVQFSSF